MRGGKFFLSLIILSLLSGIIIAGFTSAPVYDVGLVDLFGQNRKISGNRGDLVAFSIKPGAHVSGSIPFQGIVKGAYFFEANILINILDEGKHVVRQGNAIAMTDWMTTEPVTFEGVLDFDGLSKGSAYIEIRNDNASGDAKFDKNILIPIVVD